MNNNVSQLHFKVRSIYCRQVITENRASNLLSFFNIRVIFSILCTLIGYEFNFGKMLKPFLAVCLSNQLITDCSSVLGTQPFKAESFISAARSDVATSRVSKEGEPQPLFPCKTSEIHCNRRGHRNATATDGSFSFNFLRWGVTKSTWYICH